MENTDKKEPKHTFDIPSCILHTMLWTSRVLVLLQLWNSDMSVFTIFLMILFYYIIMECCIAIGLYIIKYLPIVLKDPSSFTNKFKVAELMLNDLEYPNFISGITTIVYLLIYFL